LDSRHFGSFSSHFLLWIVGQLTIAPQIHRATCGSALDFARFGPEWSALFVPAFWRVAPVLGYLNDLVIVAFGFVVVLRLVPPEVMDECRKRAAETFAAGRPVSRTAAAVVILVWVGALALIGTYVVRMVR
jgi:hypothetical protein